MAIKKSQLYSSLWASCDELRGGMDASQYKDYVLVLLFMKYVSDRYAGDPDGQIFVAETEAEVVRRIFRWVGDEIESLHRKQTSLAQIAVMVRAGFQTRCSCRHNG